MMRTVSLLLIMASVSGLAACSEKQKDALGNTAELQSNKLEAKADELENKADAAVNSARGKLEDLGAKAGKAVDAATRAGDKAAEHIENAARR